MAESTSVFDRMTADEIVKFIQENGLPAVQELQPLPEDIDRLVDLIEERFKILQMPPEQQAADQLDQSSAEADQKEQEAVAVESKEAEAQVDVGL